MPINKYIGRFGAEIISEETASKLGEPIRPIKNKPVAWSESETECLRELYAQGLSYKQIAKSINRSIKAIEIKAASLGLERADPRAWSERDVNELRRLKMTGMTYNQIAKIMHRTCASVTMKAQYLGLQTARK